MHNHTQNTLTYDLSFFFFLIILYSHPRVHSRTFFFTQTFALSTYYARKHVSLALICRNVGQTVEQSHHAQDSTRRPWRPPGLVLVFVGAMSAFCSCASAYMQIFLYTQALGKRQNPIIHVPYLYTNATNSHQAPPHSQRHME